jgi:type II secretory pathway pseudopilin PulG
MGRARTGEEGFTIIEVVVAALIVTIGALTTFGLLSSATKNTQRAKATQVALDQAQQTLEEIRSLSTEERAMTATPPHSSDQLDPNYRVNAGSGTFALTREPRGDYEKLVVNGGELYGGSGEEGVIVISGGTVSPGPTHFESGDVSGDIYRYIVWRNDEGCSEEDCPGPQDYKQIIVAVKLDTPGSQAGERGYVEVQSNFVDPTDSSANDPVPGPEGKVVTAQQFFLSDTPCSASADGTTTWTERREITEDHLLHNTLGVCTDGEQTGTTHGAPDALLLGHPPDPTPEDPESPPLYDYSNDYYLDTNPDTTKGVQIRPDDEGGCHFEPKGTTNPESQVHFWVTDPMSAEFTMTGSVTLEFYTRTLNDDAYHGTLCVYLFSRHEEDKEGILTYSDKRLMSGKNAYWEYYPEGNEFWPRGAWTKESLTMNFDGAPYPIPAGDRLGVALSVDRFNTPSKSAIPLMYDHPNFQTRIEVDTSTPIEGG